MIALAKRSFLRAISTTAFGLTAAAVGAFLLIGALLTAALFWQTNSILTEQVITSLRAEAEALAQDAVSSSPAMFAAKIKALSRDDGPALYFLADHEGRKLAGNLSRLPPELQTEVNTSGVFRYARPGELGVPSRLAVAIPVETGNDLVLIIGRDVEDQRAYADKMRWTFLLGFGGLAIAGFAAGIAVSRHLLRRIETITATSQSIMAGNMNRRIPLDGSGGELDGLASNLNEMLDRIEGLMNGLREVSDNIAHDLKTPLNRLRNSAEAALRDDRGTDAYREGLEQTIEKADELIKTFNALLLIARLEAGPLEESLEVFDVGELAEGVADLYLPAAEEAGFPFHVDVSQGIKIRGNRQLMSQALANLIDNAINYATPTGSSKPPEITVRVAKVEMGLELSVADRGAGIAAVDRERVLKRFVRLEKSRTKPGTGLGLSLVSAVARLHRGTVRLEDNEPGLRVVIALPESIIVGQDVKILELSASEH